jgi:protein TonB
MRLTLSFPASDQARAHRRRIAAFVLALVIEGLVIWLLLTFIPTFFAKPVPKPVVFGVDTDSGDSANPTTKAKAKAKSKGSAGQQAEQPVPVQPVPPPITPPPPPVPSANVMWIPRSAYVSTDLVNAPKGTAAPALNPGSGRSDAGDSDVASGRGPHGEILYAAEWYKRPSDAQLDPYIPVRDRGKNGWGLIACKTVAAYHVEDCQELGDSPRGSGLAGAVRQAAWQFLVRPPRVGGKSMVGAWVSIRVDYIVRLVKSSDDDDAKPGDSGQDEGH